MLFLTVLPVPFSIVFIIIITVLLVKQRNQKRIGTKENDRQEKKRIRDSFLPNNYYRRNSAKKKNRRSKKKNDTSSNGKMGKESPKSIGITWLYNFMFTTQQRNGMNDKGDQNERESHIRKMSNSMPLLEDEDNGIECVSVVAIDCEMVGSGFRGKQSMLARCSIVTTATTKSPTLENDISVLYDVIVRPTKKVTDYRTEYSGITKDSFRVVSAKENKNCDGLPVVSFDECKRDVSSIFASLNRKPVLVVGHGLENDFEVLSLLHPSSLTRDTACYPPLMQRNSSRGTKLYPRKLSVITKEELGIDIQHNNSDSLGHSSVEDASASLMIYLKHHLEWERHLGYPLQSLLFHNSDSSDRGTSVRDIVSKSWKPLILYLDGCNLPLALHKIKKDTTTLPTNGSDETVQWDFQLISKTNTHNTHNNHKVASQPCSTFDWLPKFTSITIQKKPSWEKVNVMFDGNMYKNCAKDKLVREVDISPQIRIEITDVGVQVDDVLVDRCSSLMSTTEKNEKENVEDPFKTSKKVTIEEVIDLFSTDSPLSRNIDPYQQSRDYLNFFVVVRRRSQFRHYNTTDKKDKNENTTQTVQRNSQGMSKKRKSTNTPSKQNKKKILSKYNLRRSEEGALCLAGLTPELQKQSLQIARNELYNVKHLLEFEMRPRHMLTSVVVTEDVLLTDRLVGNNNKTLVLNYKQLEKLT